MLTGGDRKSSAKIQKLFGGFRKEFWSYEELNKEVIDINYWININKHYLFNYMQPT
jgi:hypothetical protein